MASKQTIEHGLITLQTVFDKRIPEERRAAYISLLADLPDELLRAAIQHCAATQTFFPTPGEIREAAANLGKLSYNVPSADEAWSELVNDAHAPRKHKVYCAEYARMFEHVHDDPDNYLRAVADLGLHEGSCGECQMLTTEYQFSHPLIGEVAKRLGWPERFWSDNIGVDRGRFIKTYEDTIRRMTDQSKLLPAVRQYVDDERQLYLDDRRAALETGEHAELKQQLRRLTRSMES